MKKIIAFAFLILLIKSNSFASNYVRKAVISKSFNQDYFTAFDIDYRNDRDRLYRRHYDISIGKKFAQDLELSFKYRNIYLKQGGSWTIGEKRPQFEISKKIDLGEVFLEPRFRHDYRIIKGDDKQRPRIRLRLISKEKFFHVTPLIGNEFYYDYTDKRYSQNRFEIGLILPKYRQFLPSIYFRNDSRYIPSTRSWLVDQFAVFRIEAEF
jgi:hypothetical protein